MEQQQEYSPRQTAGLFDLQVDASLRETLKSVSIWARINAYVSFISYGVAILKGAFAKIPSLSEESSQIALVSSRGSQLAGALVTALIGVIISVYLLRFGNQLRDALDQQSQPHLENGFNNLRVYWKIIGIIVIILLSIVVLVLFLAILSGILTR